MVSSSSVAVSFVPVAVSSLFILLWWSSREGGLVFSFGVVELCGGGDGCGICGAIARQQTCDMG